MKNPEIILKPADKRMGITIWDKSWYEKKGYKFMNDKKNYRKINGFEIKAIKNKIMQWVQYNAMGTI
jgi:hypothetical protein